MQGYVSFDKINFPEDKEINFPFSSAVNFCQIYSYQNMRISNQSLYISLGKSKGLLVWFLNMRSNQGSKMVKQDQVWSIVAKWAEVGSSGVKWAEVG